MNKTFIEILNFIKNPVLEEDTNKNLSYRAKKFFTILILCYLTTFFLGPLMVIIESLGLVDLEKHAIDTLFENKSKFQIFAFAVLLAPVIEEGMFRAPLTLFKNKKWFPLAFHSSALLFGFIHITNYEINTNILLFSPILVAPQIALGFYLGYIRVKFGFIYSVLLHATYNGILTYFILTAESLT